MLLSFPSIPLVCTRVTYQCVAPMIMNHFKAFFSGLSWTIHRFCSPFCDNLTTIMLPIVEPIVVTHLTILAMFQLASHSHNSLDAFHSIPWDQVSHEHTSPLLLGFLVIGRALNLYTVNFKLSFHCNLFL